MRRAETYETDEQRKPHRDGASRHPQNCAANADPRDRDAQREQDPVESQNDETDPPAADQDSDREEDDREDR